MSSWFRSALLAGSLLSGSISFAADAVKGLHAVSRLTGVETGLTLPVSLEHGCAAGQCRVGEEIVAETTQSVPLNNTEFLPRGAEVHGLVVTSAAAGKASGQESLLAIHFNSLHLHGQSLPLKATAVAIASSMEVNDTFAPTNAAADRAMGGEANWTTRQVGGDVLTRAGWLGELDSASMQKVGFADFNGVYATPATPGGVPHALGVFSAEAHGVYGFDPATMLMPTPGGLRLQCACKLRLRRGDNLLLQVE